MRKHLWLGWLLLILVLGLGSWGTASAQDKSLYWQRYDVNLAVQSNSDILVEEIQQIQFTSGTFHFGFATIPLDRAERITDVSISETIDGQERPYTAGSSNEYGFVTQRNDDNLEITWYFPIPLTATLYAIESSAACASTRKGTSCGGKRLPLITTSPSRHHG